MASGLRIVARPGWDGVGGLLLRRKRRRRAARSDINTRRTNNRRTNDRCTRDDIASVPRVEFDGAGCGKTVELKPVEVHALDSPGRYNTEQLQ